jgi:hypothetical protein
MATYALMASHASPSKKFRQYAETARKAAAKKRDNGTQHQTPTRRRLDMLAGMRAEAERFDQQQAAFVGLADAWDDGSIPEILMGLSTKAHVERLAYIAFGPATYWSSELDGTGLTKENYIQAAQALLHISADTNHVNPVETQIADIKRRLFGSKIPGFFPTTPEVVKRMMLLADLKPDMTVLEPSAGWGNIADELRTWPVLLHVIEINRSLQEILRLKGHTLAADDFLEFDPDHPNWSMPVNRYGNTGYDRICANPPFENEQDIDHVRHMYELLKPGGRLVSIMCESAFFRSTKKAQAFQQWLVNVGAHIEKLPEGSFAKGEVPTGVAARLISVNKPTS